MTGRRGVVGELVAAAKRMCFVGWGRCRWDKGSVVVDGRWKIEDSMAEGGCVGV